MTERVNRHRLQVAAELDRFINEQALPGTGLDADSFWAGVDAIFHDLTPKNRELLAERDRLQEQLDTWHRENPGPVRDMSVYRAFLEEIGYLVEAPSEVRVSTANVDPEIAVQAGPQLVAPVDNPRYALNAANARWGSLYDALYGTDVISEEDGAGKKGAYNPVRGEKVIAFAKKFLDDHVGLERSSHAEATGYAVVNGILE